MSPEGTCQAPPCLSLGLPAGRGEGSCSLGAAGGTQLPGGREVAPRWGGPEALGLSLRGTRVGGVVPPGRTAGCSAPAPRCPLPPQPEEAPLGGGARHGAQGARPWGTAAATTPGPPGPSLTPPSPPGHPAPSRPISRGRGELMVILLVACSVCVWSVSLGSVPEQRAPRCRECVYRCSVARCSARRRRRAYL